MKKFLTSLTKRFNVPLRPLTPPQLRILPCTMS
jgi:hypothetical protein